jgi:hypothetical protein
MGDSTTKAIRAQSIDLACLTAFRIIIKNAEGQNPCGSSAFTDEGTEAEDQA